MKIVRSIVLLAAMLFLAGCILLPIPHEQWLSPKFSGRITDSSTGAPIPSAKVTLFGYGRYEEKVGSIVVYSGMDGTYSIVASRRSTWLPIWLGPAEGVQKATIRIEKEGYDPITIEDGRFTGAGMRVAIPKDVRLVRKHA